ncbi:caspase family protein [Paenibacillus sp. FSL K6-2524]|uniref:caspase family protein n=1 Tax=Paenibacillus sp. FSL K6-2524 TaxID=2954516 RepID=UPI0030F5E57C
MSVGTKINVLLIGASVYKNNSEYSNLVSVEEDITAMKDIFDQNFDAQISIFLGEDVNSVKVDVKLRDFFMNCGTSDTLVLYWAGHGDIIDNRGYLITYNSTYSNANDKISMQDLNEWIQECNAKSVLFIVDCCYSGILARNQNDISKVMNKELDINGKGKVIITATNDINAAYNLSDNSNGIFTSILVNQLQDFIDNQIRDEIDITELYSSVVRDMEDAQYKQIPCLKASLEGRLVLKLKATNSDIAKRSEMHSLSRGNRQQIEILNKFFNRRNYIDNEHFIKGVQEYLEIFLHAGKIKKIEKHIINDNVFFLNIEWFNWVMDSNIAPFTSYTAILTRRQAELVYEMINNKELTVSIMLFLCNNDIRIKKAEIYIKEESIELMGIHSRNHQLELPTENGAKYIWNKFAEDKNILVAIDDNLRVSKWDMDSISCISSFRLKDQENRDITQVKYCFTKDSLIILSYYDHKLEWSYHESDGESKIIETVGEMGNIYLSKSDEFLILYNHKSMTLISENLKKTIEFKRSFLKKGIPLIKELNEDILVYLDNFLFTYDKQFVLQKKEESVKYFV